MNSFNYEYPVRQHFCKGCAEEAIKEEMGRVGSRVLLAYGGHLLNERGCMPSSAHGLKSVESR